jgi:Uma2 family endonuclease
MATRPDRAALLSPEEYLALERRAETKSEYYDGEIVAMSGASRAHSLIVGNAFASLHGQLRGRSCELHASDMRVRVSRTGAYVYPDIVVVCGQPQFEDDQVDTLLNPTVVMKVLSPSTEANDYGRKWDQYRRLDSLQEYLLIAQDRPHVERYRRHGEGLWLFDEADGEATLSLESIGCALALRDVYEQVL